MQEEIFLPLYVTAGIPQYSQHYILGAGFLLPLLPEPLTQSQAGPSMPDNLIEFNC